ncbi:MAG: hypothetical protein DSY77_03320 [Bacteroidetes bacterium]|nr:MAG: hypothetical protein DSY77_03320 [Bacteroidota bacterium]
MEINLIDISTYFNSPTSLLPIHIICWKRIEKIALSDREKNILRYSIIGYSINEISEKLFIPSDTVKFHKRKLFEKLEVSNISEAISYASQNELI